MTLTLRRGDYLEALRTLPDASVNAMQSVDEVAKDCSRLVGDFLRREA
jgi:hypothetical protein